MKRIIWLGLLLGILYSCKTDKNNFTIKGEIKGTAPEMIKLVQLAKDGIITADSSAVNRNGEFKLKGYTELPMFYVVNASGTRGINLVVFPNDKIDLFINSENFDLDYVVEGSPESKRISSLVKQQADALQKITALSNEFESARGSADFLKKKAAIDSAYFVVISQHKKFSTDFILEDPCSFSSLMALYQQLGRKEPVFNLQQDFDVYQRVDSCLSSLYPSSEAVKSLNKKVVETREYMKIDVGAKAPGIALPDTSNRIISLDSLRGKYVLLNFWASWCSQCRSDNDFLQQIYKKYNKKGFEIYQVSLDKTSESWKNGINEDNIPWINVSDLKYWNSAPVKTYYVKNLPLYILIGPDGTIIEKEKSLVEMDVKLDELF